MRKVSVVLLAMLVAYISIACGGSGNLSRPTTFPSPSPSASVPPSSAPPASFVISDFKGTWWLEGMYKSGDLHPGADFYINVDSTGEIESEPAAFGLLPRPIGGHFTLTNADTGAFSGQITILYTEPNDTAVIDFTGSMSAEKDGFDMNYTGGSFPFQRADDLSTELGSFLIDTYDYVEPGGVYVLDGVSIVTFNPDGTMTLTKIPDTIGHWSLFRQRFIFARQDLDDGNEYVRLTATILDDVRKLDQQILEPRINGEYTVFDDEDEKISGGEFEGEQVKDNVELFAPGDLFSNWTWLNMDEGVYYCKGFNISEQGISVNAKAPHGGTVNFFNLYTGEFSMTMMHGEDQHRLVGYLSATRKVAQGVLLINGNNSSNVSLINQNHPSFDLGQMEGHWSAGLAGEYGPLAYTPCAVINFAVDNLGSVGVPYAGINGDVMFIGPSTVLAKITYDLNENRVYALAVVKDLNTGNAVCKVFRPGYEDTWDGISFMERYTPPEGKPSPYQYVGSYIYTNPDSTDPIDAVLSSGQNSFSFIKGYTVPPSEVVWHSYENYAFWCADLAEDLVFYTPPEVSEKLGRFHYANNFNAYGIRRKAADYIYCAGYNNYGQLGKGDTESGMGTVSGLVQSIIQSPSAMACGSRHTLALKYDGTVWGWGSNVLGQLGDGSSDDRILPVQVANLTDVIAVAAGGYHSMALKKDGTVWTWGYNDEAQLGLGPESYSSIFTPAMVPNLTGVIAISAFGDHCMVLKNDGTVWTWGSNGYYQLGDGSDNRRSGTPVQVLGLSNVIAIDAGDNLCLALKSDGTVWAWGYNSYGAIGKGNFDTTKGISQVLYLSNIVQISASRHCLALKDDGTVWAWGDNGFGQLGLGYDGLNVNAPVMLTTISEIGFVAAGMGVSYAVAGNGRTWSWGDNTNKKLFDNSEGFRNAPEVLGTLFFKPFICTGTEHAFIY